MKNYTQREKRDFRVREIVKRIFHLHNAYKRFSFDIFLTYTSGRAWDVSTDRRTNEAHGNSNVDQNKDNLTFGTLLKNKVSFTAFLVLFNSIGSN